MVLSGSSVGVSPLTSIPGILTKFVPPAQTPLRNGEERAIISLLTSANQKLWDSIRYVELEDIPVGFSNKDAGEPLHGEKTDIVAADPADTGSFKNAIPD